jgi:hypothetical protein
MTLSKRARITALATALAIAATELGGIVTGPVIPALVSDAEARIGRPLTPVSVAGVARRTVRRCAVGVYYC